MDLRAHEIYFAKKETVEHRQKCLYLLRCFERFLPARGERLLDLGCGNGWFLLFLRDRFDRLTGIDASPVAIRLAKQKVPDADLRKGDLAHEEFPPADTILLLDVLEHMEKPVGKRVLRKAANALCPGGRLIIYTPVSSVYLSLKNVKYLGHVYVWERLELIRCITSFGLVLLYEGRPASGKILLVGEKAG